MTTPHHAWRAIASCCFVGVFSTPGQADEYTLPNARQILFRASPPPAYAPDLHTQALARWRSRELRAQDLLHWFDAWLATTADPAHRRRILSDAIVVASQAGLATRTLAYAAAEPMEQLQAYALGPLIGAARALGNTQVQGQAVRRLLVLQPDGWDARVQETLWLIDQRRLDEAQAGIERLSARPRAPVAAQQAVRELRGALAEARGDRPLALLHYQEVLALAPEHRYALRSTTFLTAGLGAPGAAWADANAKPGLFTELEIAGMRQAALGEKLRWGVSERDLRPNDPQRFGVLDEVIREGAVLSAQLAAAARPVTGRDSDEWKALQRRLAADRVVAQFERGSHAQAVALYEELLAQYGSAPYYATAAAAGSQAQLRRPGLAVPLYEEALRVGGKAVRVPSDIHVGLVYAYLDTARFAQADALVDDMIARTPPLLSLSPQAGRPNNDYGDLQGLRALVALYTDRPARAEEEFRRLVSLAPLNTAYRTGLARTLRLRQHPQAAAAAFEELLTDDPRSIDAQAGYAETLFDTGEPDAARRRVDALAQTHPESPSVRSAVRTRDTVMAPRLEIDAGASRGGGTLSNRDSRVDMRLSSGWSGSQTRFFAHQWLGTAEVGADKPRHARSGLGLEWLSGPWRLEGEAHQSSSGPGRTGLALAADWRVSDAWRLSARWDSNSLDVPWRARQAGINAREAQLQARYVVNESRIFSAQGQLRNYSDGNRRTGAGVAWQERWVSGPRFQLQTTLAADSARNSLQATPYFSPARESAAALTVRGQYLTWKRDDRTFVQVVEVGAGRYRQAGFGSGPTRQLRYAHEWNWGAGWQLRYGLGTGSHPYDGVGERNKEVFLHFSMPFL